uniref:transposase domain-containing protein n=1 Tax=Actinomadura sp. CA-154981 TaxID=3240037 RepID=UPI003F492D5D
MRASPGTAAFERRRRLPPSHLMVYIMLALCLFARETYEKVIRLLTGGLPCLRILVQIADHRCAERGPGRVIRC